MSRVIIPKGDYPARNAAANAAGAVVYIDHHFNSDGQLPSYTLMETHDARSHDFAQALARADALTLGTLANIAGLAAPEGTGHIGIPGRPLRLWRAIRLRGLRCCSTDCTHFPAQSGTCRRACP